ncbi:unnamed protein product [Scytosiphon promiscuus]
MNDLHRACYQGNVMVANAILCSGSYDVDERSRGSDNLTPLMIAAFDGHSRIMKPLLDRGADQTLTGFGGLTPLHMTAQNGHLAATKMLIEAGSELETRNDNEYTPLHVAAMDGFSKVMRALIDAGAIVDTRLSCGATPLFNAAMKGHVDALRELLLAKANPMLGASSFFFGGEIRGADIVPLDVAAGGGHLCVARELIEQVGIARCGGLTGGVTALRRAVEQRHVDIAAVLIDAGVTDVDGQALNAAAGVGPDTSVKLLLQQHKKHADGSSIAVDPLPVANGVTAMVAAVEGCHSSSARIVRLLLDADADPTSAIRVRCRQGSTISHESPWATAKRMMREKTVEGEPITGEQLRSLKATHRLLLQSNAVLASSWLWRSGALAAARPADGGGGGVKAARMSGTSLKGSLPILRRRNRTRSVLFKAMSRYSQKR